jgi:3-deoxy-D-manno-octulosonate 8-phosphate phosphatase (KDO 8-P phosphatase)
MDCDGVLTDGRVYFLPMPDGSINETKGFDCHDGIALAWARQAGIDTGVITGRGGFAVEARAHSSHMRYLYQGNTQKLPIFEEILADSGLDPAQIAYIGDDITDFPILRRVGLSAAPSNSRPEVLAEVHFRTAAAGGAGAVREVIERILKAQGRWEEVMAKYSG